MKHLQFEKVMTPVGRIVYDDDFDAWVFHPNVSVHPFLTQSMLEEMVTKLKILNWKQPEEGSVPNYRILKTNR